MNEKKKLKKKLLYLGIPKKSIVDEPKPGSGRNPFNEIKGLFDRRQSSFGEGMTESPCIKKIQQGIFIEEREKEAHPKTIMIQEGGRAFNAKACQSEL